MSTSPRSVQVVLVIIVASLIESVGACIADPSHGQRVYGSERLTLDVPEHDENAPEKDAGSER